MGWCHKMPHKEGDMPVIEQCERADSARVGGDEVLDSNKCQPYMARCPSNSALLGPRISAQAGGTARAPDLRCSRDNSMSEKLHSSKAKGPWDT